MRICTLSYISIFIIIYCIPRINTTLETLYNKSRCFAGLGCVRYTEDWFNSIYRPDNELPLSRHSINTQFLLYTLDSQSTLNMEIVSSLPSTINISSYEVGKHLKLLIHDFTASGFTGWIKNMARSLLQSDNSSNVVAVDWESGADPPYVQAIANARLVALEINAFLSSLQKNNGLRNEQIHVIGHGIGAHIAGYVGAAKGGSKSDGISKLTGLDPSGPYFERMPNVVKLDLTDARFVEIIHTDAEPKGQGIIEPTGHVDYYPNNGYSQPGCNVSSSYPPLLKLTRASLKPGNVYPGCSHKRAFKLYMDSIQNKFCTYIGYHCSSYRDFLHGNCTSCEMQDDNVMGCARFGLGASPQYTSPNQTCSVQYFLKTTDNKSYCLDAYKFQIQFANTQNASRVEGYFYVEMGDEYSRRAELMINEDQQYSEFRPGKNYTFLGWSAPPTIKHIPDVRFTFLNKQGSLSFAKNKPAYISNMTITPLTGQNIEHSNEICSTGNNPEKITELEPNHTVTFEPCTLEVFTEVKESQQTTEDNGEGNK